jgi:lysozyme
MYGLIGFPGKVQACCFPFLVASTDRGTLRKLPRLDTSTRHSSPFAGSQTSSSIATITFNMTNSNDDIRPMMRVSQRGIELVKSVEGLRLEAYQCSAGVWTIGYGSTNGVKEGMKITEKQAEARIARDLQRFESAVNSLVDVPLSQEQFDALVSFAYNVGENALAKSTLLKKLNAGDYRGAAVEFERWNKVGKKPNKGLTRRRAAEKALFLEGTASEPVKPLAKSRTMAGATATAAAGGSAVALGVVQQIGDAAPAVSVVSQVAQTAQEHPSGLLIVFGVVVILAAAFIAYARWDDRRKGLR